MLHWSPSPISVRELLAPSRDEVFHGRVLTALVVTTPVKISSILLGVEDAKRHAILVGVYDVAREEQKRWLPGRVLRIRNPYVRLAMDGSRALRVDHPAETVVLGEEVVPLCWHCLKVVRDAGGLKTCARCRQARYCSAECQREDWDVDGYHKLQCRGIDMW